MAVVDGIWLPFWKRLDVMRAPLPPRATHKEIEDLAYSLGGRGSRPQGPVVLVGADGQTPILLVGLGQAEASELQDLAHDAIERSEENLKKEGSAMRFDTLRERAGYAPREKVGELIAEGLERRRMEAKRNPVTKGANKAWERWRNHPQYQEWSNGPD